MEPRRSMTRYALVLSAAFVGLAFVGWWGACLAGGVFLLVAGVWLTGGLRRWLAGCTPPEHWSRLARLVSVQWAGAGVTGVLAAGLVASGVLRGLEQQTPVLTAARAVLAGTTVAMTAVFWSSLVDWYVILPRLGGFGAHPAPCEAPGEQWKMTTSIWLFHRGLATLFVVFAATGGLFYLAAQVQPAGAKVGLVLLATAVGGGMAIVQRQGLYALSSAFNRSIYVGDTILVTRHGQAEGERAVRRRAYVVDVSVQGIKYKLLQGDDYVGPRFQRKGIGPTREDDEIVGMLPPEARDDEHTAVPCRAGCSGVNWYCRHNAHAYDY